MTIRFFSLISIFTLLFVGLGFNLYHLQIQKGTEYVTRAEARDEALTHLTLRRGQIFFTDRNNEKIPVALNRDEPVIYVVPKEIKDIEETAGQISDLLNIDRATIREALKNKNTLFKLLIDKASDEEVQKVQGTHIEGLYTDTKQYRFYPFEELGSQVLGFVGLNETHSVPTGLYGMEKMNDTTLAKGNDIALTIDRNLQAQAEQLLQKLIKNNDATGGTIIIQEPYTGKILTFANAPSFNPNSYKGASLQSFLNPGIQYLYEPGSVFKPLTMSAGIDTGAITPDTTFVDKGFVKLNGKTIKNANSKVYGKVTMTQVIENSINTGSVFAEQQTGNGVFYDYLKRFGFGDKTGAGFPDEISGSLKNLERKDARAVDFATASFGQGTGVTPIQLVNAFSAIANRGVLMKPFVDTEGKPTVVRRVIKEETAEKVIKMMEAAVKKANVTTIPGYNIAGKTGTALIPDFKKGGYSDELIHTFVGMVPSTNPRVVMLLKLDRPKVGELAGLTVVPGFKELAQFVINYYTIPPDVISEPADQKTQ